MKLFKTWQGYFVHLEVKKVPALKSTSFVQKFRPVGEPLPPAWRFEFNFGHLDGRSFGFLSFR